MYTSAYSRFKSKTAIQYTELQINEDSMGMALFKTSAACYL